MMKDEIVRSPLFYVGDKYKLIGDIRNNFPAGIKRLIEPFAGGGSVFMNTPAGNCMVNDIDTHVIRIHRLLYGYRNHEEDFFRDIFDIVKHYGLSLSLREDSIPAELKVAYPKTYFAKYNKAAYSRLKEDYNEEGRVDDLKLYVLIIYGFNRMFRFNKAGLFNLPVGNVDFNQNTYNAIKNYFRISREKEQITYSSEDFRPFLGNIDFEPDDLVYLDPPYLITFSEYNKLWNEETETDLLRLLDDLDERGVRFAISNVTHYKGKVNEIFLEWVGRYRVIPIKSNYISFHDNTKKKFNEVLVINY